MLDDVNSALLTDRVETVGIYSKPSMVHLSRQFENFPPATKTLAFRLSKGVYGKDRRPAEPRIRDDRGPLVRSIGTPQTFLSDAQVDELVAAYQAGAGTHEVAKMFGVHHTTAIAHLRRRSIPLRRRGLDETEQATACRLYAEGLTLMEVGLRLGVAQATVGRAVVKAGYPLRLPDRGRRLAAEVSE